MLFWKKIVIIFMQRNLIFMEYMHECIIYLLKLYVKNEDHTICFHDSFFIVVERRGKIQILMSSFWSILLLLGFTNNAYQYSIYPRRNFFCLASVVWIYEPYLPIIENYTSSFAWSIFLGYTSSFCKARDDSNNLICN